MTETHGWDVDAVAKIVLAEQEEPEDVLIPTVAHWASLVERHASFNMRDKMILAISPVSRARLAVARHRYRNDFLVRAANSNNIPVMQAAAASAGRRRIRFVEMKNFAVAIEPSGPSGWLIICDVLEGFPVGSRVELTDSEGFIWISGSPNEEGRLVARHEGVANPLEGREPFAIHIDGVILT